MAYVRKRPKRGPRPNGLEFLRSLATGARVVERGPVGRCLKQRWCEPVADGSLSVGLIVALTGLGRILLEEADGTIVQTGSKDRRVV